MVSWYIVIYCLTYWLLLMSDAAFPFHLPYCCPCAVASQISNNFSIIPNMAIINQSHGNQLCSCHDLILLGKQLKFRQIPLGEFTRSWITGHFSKWRETRTNTSKHKIENSVRMRHREATVLFTVRITQMEDFLIQLYLSSQAYCSVRVKVDQSSKLQLAIFWH